jgi:hypothetical protein
MLKEARSWIFAPRIASGEASAHGDQHIMRSKAVASRTLVPGISGDGSFPGSGVGSSRPRKPAGLEILAPYLPPFAIAPLDPVEKPGCLFARKHRADIAGRESRLALCVKFVAFGKRRALVEGVIRSAYACADQRRRFDDEDAVQSTVPVVVGEPPKGHLGFIAHGGG